MPWSSRHCWPFVHDRRRLFGPAGRCRISRLHRECFERSWSAGSFARFLDEPACIIFSAHNEAGGLAGFTLVRQAADEAKILTICVALSARRRGCAAGLMRHAITHLGARGATRLHLEVEADNQGAIALYRRLGFAAAGRRTGYYQGRRDALILSRVL